MVSLCYEYGIRGLLQILRGAKYEGDLTEGEDNVLHMGLLQIDVIHIQIANIHVVKATLLEECIFQGGVFNLHAVKRASLKKGACKCAAIKMDAIKAGVYKAAAVEGTPIDFFDDEFTMVRVFITTLPETPYKSRFLAADNHISLIEYF